MRLPDLVALSDMAVAQLRTADPAAAAVVESYLGKLDGVMCTLHYAHLGEIPLGVSIPVRWKAPDCLLTEVCIENPDGYHIEMRVRGTEIPSGFPTALLEDLEQGDVVDLFIANDSASAPLGALAFIGFYLSR